MMVQHCAGLRSGTERKLLMFTGTSGLLRVRFCLSSGFACILPIKHRSSLSDVGAVSHTTEEDTEAVIKAIRENNIELTVVYV